MKRMTQQERSLRAGVIESITFASGYAPQRKPVGIAWLGSIATIIAGALCVLALLARNV
jgi:hypothetical protein